MSRGFVRVFLTASILDGCGDLGYLLIDQLEKRQMLGQEAEKMKLKGKGRRVWCGRRL
jgi:hypothetical protein